MSVGEKIFKGAIWKAVSKFGAQGINFVVLILLARLLVPEDFGLVGMATVFIAFLGYFTEFGLVPALIQAKEIDEDDCQTVFWSVLLFSIVAYVGTFFLAPLIALFYQESSMIGLVRVLFINFLFATFAYVPEVKEVRALRYDRIAVADLIGLTVSGLTAVVLALLKFGLWSLVIQQITMTLVRGIVLILYTKWLPRACFSFVKFKALFRSGSHFTLKNLISYCSKNIDSLLVGKLLGPAALGLYSLSLRIAGYATTKVWTIFGEMFIPAFVSFRNEIERVKKNFARVSVGGGILLAPLLIGIFFGAAPLVTVLFGEKWLEAIPVIKILVIFFLLDSLFLSDESILIALDKINTINVVRIISSLALLITGYILTNKFGLIGMAAAFSAVSIAAILIIKVLLLTLLDIRLHRYLKDLKIVFSTVLCLSVLFGFYSWFTVRLLPPLLFLLGEAVIVVSTFIYLILRYKLINLNERKINFDNMLQVNP